MDIFNFKIFLKCGVLDDSVSLYFPIHASVMVQPQVCLVISLMFFSSFPHKRASLD